MVKGERRQQVSVANAAVFEEELGQRRPRQQAPVSFLERLVDAAPSQVKVAGNFPVIPTGPATDTLVKAVGQGQDVIDVENRSAHCG